VLRRAAGLLTRGALPRRLPGPRASGVSAWERLPSQRRDRPGLAPGSLSARLWLSRLVCPSVQAAVWRWAPVVAWAALIFGLSSVPDLGTGLGTWDLVLRKIAHATEYAILAALLVRALRRPGWAIALGIAYSISDEVHQSFISGRQGSPVDVGIDAIGVVVGAVIAARWWS
jgi:VanZ family protein